MVAATLERTIRQILCFSSDGSSNWSSPVLASKFKFRNKINKYAVPYGKANDKMEKVSKQAIIGA